MSTIRMNKIILAIDPFAEEARVGAEKVSHSVKNLITRKDVLIEAVFVMTPFSVGVPLKEFPEHQEFFVETAKELLGKILSDYANIATTKISVLPQGSNSVRTSVEKLLRHAEHTEADLIAVSTHVRKGVDRWFLGSFAETLLLRTTLPVLINNPTSPWEPVFKHVLFATDFSKASTIALGSVISVARLFNAKITLFHRTNPVSVFFPPPGLIASREWELRKVEGETKALQMKEASEKSGVPIEIDVDIDSYPIAYSILNAANRLKVSLIAMAATPSLPFIATGSIPRQVVRGAPCPVLILPSITRNNVEEPK